MEGESDEMDAGREVERELDRVRGVQRDRMTLR
jgi:hypothetical protein